jgi:hypothetical protein
VRAARLDGEDAILLPFDAQTGAAAFARGGLGHVVFDTSKAIDLAALRNDPIFGSARITLLPASTQLTMAMPAGRWLALRHRRDGWAVVLAPGRAPPDTAPVSLRNGVVSIGIPAAHGAVVIVDPATGEKMLVGTVRDHGAAVLVPHASPEFTLLPSWEGAVVLAGSDRTTLRAGKTGFALSAATGPPLSAVLPDASQVALESAGALTRRFDIPPLPVAALLRRMSGDVAAAAAAPKQARFRSRLRAATDMLALGLDREAAAVLAAARADDPSREAQADARALLAMSQFLAGIAPSGEGSLADPALGASDEVALWRALAQPQAMSMAERAAVVAADWRLLLSYPPPLRRRLMPQAGGILVDGRQPGAAQALLDAAGDDMGGGLALVRARLLLAQGKAGAALALLDHVAASADRKHGAIAWRLAVEQRLRTGQLSAAKAADALLSQIDRWRVPAFETEARLRGADLLGQAGDFRGALAQLRDTDRLFPDAHAQVHDAEQHAVRMLLQAGTGARLAPLDLVALVDENVDLLGEAEVAHELTPLLVDKLMALDLPERAEKLVVKLLNATDDPAAKARLGATLAGLRLDQRDATGALAALDGTESAEMPSAVVETRGVQRARAMVQLGQEDQARAVLSRLTSIDALTLQAGLMEKARDWPHAEAALLMLAKAQVPESGALSDTAQDVVLRLASAASQAGDAATLHALQLGSARQLSPGPRAALFQMLVTQPVQGIADLPRSGREAEAARSLPAALAHYETR